MKSKQHEYILKAFLKTMNCVNEASIGVVNHFSHNGRWIYDDATQVARAAKFLAAYDSMQIDF